MNRLPLPTMQCDPGCGACCGPVLCTPAEFEAVAAHAVEHGVIPQRQGLTCPWYQDGQCRVYDVRPFVCRMFGHSKKLVCCKGYNVNISSVLERKLFDRYRPREDARLLHEVFLDWQDMLEASR